MTNFSVIPIDDYEMFFGMCFIDYLRPIMILHEDIILITQESKSCVMNVCRKMKLSPYQLEKGLRKNESMFTAILSKDDPPTWKSKEMISRTKLKRS